MERHIELPWIEKYRPNEMETIMLNNFLKEKIDTILDNETIPNLVLTGEPGTGKTSTILILINELYGDDSRNNVLELNASDDRGLSIISSTIIPFCQKKTSHKQKIIILDEADSITNKAQQLLNNVITEYKDKCRFVFICNDISKINEPILSKCLVINYPKLPYEDILRKLLDICDQENIDYEEENIRKLIDISNNDIRKAINNLECVYKTFNRVTEENMLLLFDRNKMDYIRRILIYCIDKDFNSALALIVKNIDVVSLCAGTHNEDSSMLLTQLMKESNVDLKDKHVYFAQLLGMSDHISYNLSNAGYNVAKYVPYGPVNEVLPYLIRRAEENTSVAGQTSRELSLISKELNRRKK
jgi:replication factor C subunit 2/4